ncbi:GNAT family N-acetyltransferase [Haloarchaeobius sp. DYHT-AS-18]|uniref:GNAT family N-acetyltransferase n=1 Tax=Haloarchaeobius sp. DYHT-AS-18 TaxID=3446117 RepID=UPI003EC126A9
MTDVIRAAEPRDLPSIRALQTCLPEPASDLFTDLPPGVTLVSEADGLVVGYIHAFTGEPAYATELAVAPANRREGRGKRLFQSLFVHLRRAGCQAVTLTVQPENEGARDLYEELGFVVEERLPGYFEDGGDALRMRRPL